MGIHLVTVVGGRACLGTLRQFLAHYIDSGVDSVVLNVHATTRKGDVVGQIEAIAADFGIGMSSIVIGPWSQVINPMLYWVSRVTQPGEWFVVADHDEFQVYPDQLGAIVKTCERRGYDYVEGCFIDRAAKSGQLEAVDPAQTLWTQYPVGCQLSAKVLRANSYKVVLAKGSVMLGGGQHRALSGVGCPPLTCYVPVHHFKWTGGIELALADRVRLYTRLSEPFGEESTRFLEWLGGKGRMDLGDPMLRAALCEPRYPHWEAVIQERVVDPHMGGIASLRGAAVPNEE